MKTFYMVVGEDCEPYEKGETNSEGFFHETLSEARETADQETRRTGQRYVIMKAVQAITLKVILKDQIPVVVEQIDDN